MTDLFLVFIAAALANNLVLEYLLGVSPAFAVSRSIDTAMGMSLAMLLLLPLSTVSCYMLNILVLIPLRLEYLQTLAFVIVITFILLSAEKLLGKFRPSLHEKIAVFMPLLLVNTSLLGIALLEIQNDHGIVLSLISGVGSALGFGLTVIIFSALRQRISVSDVPLPFRGASILLITLGIISMAFLGFVGIA